MRVRNPRTGTVVEVGDETGRQLTATGWESADSSPAPRRSTKGAPSDAGGEDAAEPVSEESKPKRRKRS